MEKVSKMVKSYNKCYISVFFLFSFWSNLIQSRPYVYSASWKRLCSYWSPVWWPWVWKKKLLVWKKVWKKSWSLDPKICANPVLCSGRNMQRDLECFPFRPKFWKFCLEIKWNGPFRFGPTGIVFRLTFIHLSLLFPFFPQYCCSVSCLQVQYGRHQGKSVRIRCTPPPIFIPNWGQKGRKDFFSTASPPPPAPILHLRVWMSCCFVYLNPLHFRFFLTWPSS